MQVGELALLSLLALLSSFASAGRIAALHLHTQKPTPLDELSFLGGMGGPEQLAYLTIPIHFHLPLLHQGKVCKKQVTRQNLFLRSLFSSLQLSIKIIFLVHQLYILYNIALFSSQQCCSILLWSLQLIRARMFRSNCKPQAGHTHKKIKIYMNVAHKMIFCVATT